MMTQSHYRKNRKKRHAFIVLFIAVSSIALFSYAPFAQYISGIGLSWVKPLWVRGEDMRMSGVGGVFMSKSDLLRENNMLRRDVYRMSLLVMDRTILLRENELLKEKLGYVDKASTTIATILADKIAPKYATIILDRGVRSGVRRGNRVSVAHVAIGYIRSVYDNTAKMTLYSESGNSVDVLLGDNYIPTIAHGRGGGNYIIELPRDLPVALGDQVISRYGAVRIIGFVEYIDSQPNDPFKRILFRSPVDIHKIRFVEIEKNENNI